MNSFPVASKFQPTKHAIERLRQRFYPDLSEKQAAELLTKLARQAKALKVSGGRN
jgi:hypothetical protein